MWRKSTWGTSRFKKWKFNISMCWRKKLIGSFRMVVDLVYNMMLARWMYRRKRPAQWWASPASWNRLLRSGARTARWFFWQLFRWLRWEFAKEWYSTLFARHSRAQRKSTRCCWRGICWTQRESKVKSAIICYGLVSTSFYDDIGESCIDIKGGGD